MAHAQDLANSKYKELCAQFGDLVIRHKAIERDMSTLLVQIEALNSQVPLMMNLESAIQADASKADDGSGKV